MACARAQAHAPSAILVAAAVPASARPASAGLSPLERAASACPFGFSPPPGDVPRSRARLCVSDVVPRDLFDVQCTHLPHDRDELVIEDLEHAVDTGLAERGEPPDVGPANTDGAGTEAKRLQDVGATAYAAIDEHGNASAHRI